MSQEQMKVLQMLDEGKITTDEATTLLQKVATPVTPLAPEPERSLSPWSEIGEWLRKLLAVINKS